MTNSSRLLEVKYQIEDTLTEAMVLLVKNYVGGYENIEASKTNIHEFFKTFKQCFVIIKGWHKDTENHDIFMDFKKLNIRVINHLNKMDYYGI
jgi:hypothetical protein